MHPAQCQTLLCQPGGAEGEQARVKLEEAGSSQLAHLGLGVCTSDAKV